MEPPQGPRKPLSGRRARSLDRLQDPRRDSEPGDCQCLSMPTSRCRRMLRRTASDGTRCAKSLAQSSEAQGPTATALSPEETREFLPSEPRPPQDTKKDKAQWRTQQGWLRTMMNFFFGTGHEESKEKASKRAKGKEGPPEPAETPETPGEPAPRKKAHHKKASRKKHSHKKHSAEEVKGAEGQEAKAAAASCCGKADLGPGAGEDTIIQKIVELLQKVGDQWEEEQRQASQPEVAPHPPAPVVGRKSQERKSSVTRAFSHKKHSREEPKRTVAAEVSSPESRRPKRPSFLPLCVGSHRPSNSSSLGMEAPEVPVAPSTADGDPSPLELSTPAGSRGPEEDLQLDRASEFKEFIQKIIALLQDAEEQVADKQVQEPEVAVENLATACRKKCQEKKSSFRKAFSHKKHSFKETKRTGAAGAASPESRPPKRPSFLPLCVGGHRSSTCSNPDLEDLEFQEFSPAEGSPGGCSEAPFQARSHKPEVGLQPEGADESKELNIQKLVALLQEADGQLGEQIRRYPSFKRFFYRLSDSSLRKLVATLHCQEAHSAEPDRNLAEGSYPFVFDLANKPAGNNYQAVLSLVGLRYRQPSYGQFPYREAQPNITSPQSQSPD
ncbi:protein BNIP5 isoform X2 [Phacochoerus africanus]|uniref:protein BNIP5 isoform X2 n=1 Tax=Phacochoerus africanus TaxID=41426 RepID=UPI001FDAC8D0|nr:protein BNIP5 isoform X2 [Phacochoerus africanus]